MPVILKCFPGTCCGSEGSASIERTSDCILAIHDERAGRYLGITTELDLSGRTIRKIWRAFALSWQKVYSLDDYIAVEIQDKIRLFEGYELSFFSVSLSGKNHRLKLYLTDDPEDAKAAQTTLSDFLSRSRASTPGRQ